MEFSVLEAKYVINDVDLCLHQPASSAEIVIILHPCPRDTGKFAAQGPNIMSPKGCLLPPEGRRAGGSRPEGGNRQPEGDIMWPAGG